MRSADDRKPAKPEEPDFQGNAEQRGGGVGQRVCGTHCPGELAGGRLHVAPKRRSRFFQHLLKEGDRMLEDLMDSTSVRWYVID